MQRSRRLFAAAALAGAALCLVGSRSADAARQPPRLEGTLRCSGGSTMLSLVASWGRRFHEAHPQAAVQVDPRVTLAATGFRQLLAGRVDLVDFVREPFPAEVAAFERKFGYPPLLINVANGSFDTRGGTHAIAIYVNASNPLRHLTLGQLAAIFSGKPEGAAGPIATWGAVGLAGSWTKRPIHVYGMTPLRASGNPPGIVNFMEIRLLHGGRFRADLRAETGRPGESALQAIVRAVARDPEGIGYSGFAYALPGVKTVALAERRGAPYVRIGPQTVADRAYPLSRQIYFGLNSPPGRPLSPLVRAFIALALSPAGQREVGRTTEHFLPLVPEQLARSRLQLRHPGPLPPYGERQAPARLAPAPHLDASRAISIVGYNDMREMLEALDALYARRHPGIHFVLTLEGTRTAPAALASGRSLLAPMGAAFSPSELAAYRRDVGSDPVPFEIAHDSLDARALSGPLAIFVPAGNPLPELTFRQLALIFADGSDELTWGQVGLTGAWAHRPIHPYGLGPTTALGGFMRQHVLADRPFDRQFTGLSESAEVVRRVGADPLAIGFAAMNRASPAVRVVPLARQRAERPSAGSRADLISGRYPLDRSLLIYVRVPPGGRLDPRARSYLRLALSPAGQRAIASGHLGYLPLSAAQRSAQLARLAALP